MVKGMYSKFNGVCFTVIADEDLQDWIKALVRRDKLVALLSENMRIVPDMFIADNRVIVNTDELTNAVVLSLIRGCNVLGYSFNWNHIVKEEKFS